MHRGDLNRAENLAIAYLRRHPQDSTSWEVWSAVLRAREQRADEERILRRGVDFTGGNSPELRITQPFLPSSTSAAVRKGLFRNASAIASRAYARPVKRSKRWRAT